jgi:hypothetical protein
LERNAALHKSGHGQIPPLRIAARYAAGRPRAPRRPTTGRRGLTAESPVEV